MPDFELDAMLEIDDSQVDQVNDELQVGGGGDLSATDKREQEGVVAGGVSKGLAGAAIIGGILSQLKSVTGFLDGIFQTLSTAFLPIIEGLTNIFRPVLETIQGIVGGATDVVGGAGGSATRAGSGALLGGLLSGAATGAAGGSISPDPLTTAGGAVAGGALGLLGFDVGEIVGDAGEAAGGALEGAFEFFQSGAPDLSGEAQKQEFRDTIDSKVRGKTGGGRKV